MSDEIKITTGGPEGQAEIKDGSADASPALRATDMIPGPTNPFPGPVDFAKPVRTTGGKYAVKILAIDYALTKPVIGRLMGVGSPLLDARIQQWSVNGLFDDKPGCLDLENVPEAQPAERSEAEQDSQPEARQ